MATLINQFDFSIGKKVSKRQIKEWHKRVLIELKNGNQISLRASGNSIVIGVRNDGEEPNIEIYEITSGYKCFNYDL